VLRRKARVPKQGYRFDCHELALNAIGNLPTIEISKSGLAVRSGLGGGATVDPFREDTLVSSSWRHSGGSDTADPSCQTNKTETLREHERPAMTMDLLERIEGFRDKWPFAPRYARVNGWRMHYVDEGAGDPILLLHGNPTWGFLYRDLIRPLVTSGRRVIVPDMIGFGLSEKPAREQAHSLDGHIANLTGLVRQLDLQRLTVVCHDWGGPTGLGFAMSNPERVRALAVMSTWAWPTPPAEFHTRLFPWRIMHAPLVGPYLLGRHNVLARRGVYLSVVDRDKFRHEAQAVYDAVLPDPDTRLLTWTWPRWIPLDDTARAHARFAWLEAELATSKLPAVIIWGREDEVFDAATFAVRFKHLLPHADGPHMVTGRHFLQEDSGPEIAGLIATFLDRLDKQGRK
jgi:pimeloyl-ACP methyl ester carboxylesterase